MIRGLDGDRVVVLEDGQRMGDLSSQSGDHGVPVNPAAAKKIEVVRGPATLLYGANAIGGLVNVITDRFRRSGARGPAASSRLISAATVGRPAAPATSMSVTESSRYTSAGAAGEGDYSTPEGEVENSQSRSEHGHRWRVVDRRAFLRRGEYGYDDSKYGIPIVEEGLICLTPRRHSFSVRAGAASSPACCSRIAPRSAFGATSTRSCTARGRHDVRQRDRGRRSVALASRSTGKCVGSVGGWYLNRQFEATGAEALSPPIDQNSFGRGSSMRK